MESVLQAFPQQCKDAMNIGHGIKLAEIDRIIVAGMGGSAFAGDVIKAIASDEIEVSVVRDYSIPKNSNEKTLVFVVSYSGNTEETLSAFEDAINKKCKIIGISSGGKLEELCRKNKVPFVKVPSGIQPRCALGYLSIPMLVILQENKIVQNLELELIDKDLQNPSIKTKGLEIAKLLGTKIPLIYSSEKLKCLSYGWKTRINENSKIHAFSNQIPELNHNELVGYTNKIGSFCTIILVDKDDNPFIKKRFFATKSSIEKLGGECILLETMGSNRASRIFSALHLGDWVSYYLALEYGIDPQPVEVIENFKKELVR